MVRRPASKEFQARARREIRQQNEGRERNRSAAQRAAVGEKMKFAHLDRRQQPKRPGKADGQQNNSRDMGPGEPLRDLSEVRLHQAGQADENEERARHDARGLQGEIVDHWWRKSATADSSHGAAANFQLSLEQAQLKKLPQ